MARVPIKAVIGGLLFVGTPSWASYVSAPPLTAGMVGIVNTVTGVISICYRYNNNEPPRCVSVGSFLPASNNIRIVAAEGGHVFHIYDAVSGKVTRCQIDVSRISRLSSGWSCAQASARLP